MGPQKFDVGDSVAAIGFTEYEHGVVEGLVSRPAATEKLRKGDSSLRDIWVEYREVRGLKRLLSLHETWVNKR